MRGRDSWRFLFLTVVVTFTLSLHYMFLPYPPWVDLIHRRICYVPIILGALWFGLRGGLIVSGVISLATLPLALLYTGPFWGDKDMIEIIFYLGIGAMAGILVDRKDAEHRKGEALRERLRQSERLAALGRMAAGIAHEVRTPLGSIQGAAEILAEDYPPGHKRRPFFEILINEIERLKGVVRDFLDLGRPIAVECAPLSPTDVVAQCFRSLEPFAHKRGVELVLAGVKECPLLYADLARLHQALTNLVRNAVQASPKGGGVEVELRGSDGGCLIGVTDHGPGLPKGEEEKLFEPFFTRRKDGTGLGLALVEQVAEAHGGWVRGESLPTGGSRFTLWLPGSPEGDISVQGNGADAKGSSL